MAFHGGPAPNYSAPAASTPGIHTSLTAAPSYSAPIFFCSFIPRSICFRSSIRVLLRLPKLLWSCFVHSILIGSCRIWFILIGSGQRETVFFSGSGTSFKSQIYDECDLSRVRCRIKIVTMFSRLNDGPLVVELDWLLTVVSQHRNLEGDYVLLLHSKQNFLENTQSEQERLLDLENTHKLVSTYV